MCGRYTISHSTEEILERFNVLKEIIDLAPNYNVAPSQMVPVVRATIKEEEPVRVLEVVKWGLVPFWVKDPKQMRPFINARVETIIAKPSFKQAVSKKRCIIPADGFYEWKKVDGKKQPMRIRLPGNELFGIAGIYDDWTAPDGTVIRTCAIITVPGNEAMAGIHDRMPAILTPEAEQLWLDTEIRDISQLTQLLKPYENEIETYAVSTIVNSAKTNGADCVLALAT